VVPLEYRFKGGLNNVLLVVLVNVLAVLAVAPDETFDDVHKGKLNNGAEDEFDEVFKGKLNNNGFVVDF
jgi:hypothetical protein